jgi:hypothetical protein
MNIEEFKKKIDNFYSFLNKDETFRYHYYNILSFENQNIFGYTCPTQVRKSSYGNGLFASRFINKDTILSIYPTHGISVKNKDGLTSTQLTVAEEHNEVIFKNTDYCINIGEEDISIYGCPSIQNNSWLKGHIANDGSYDEKNKDLDIAPFVISLLINDKKNNTTYEFIEHKGINWLVLISKRDILADEEIFVNYGEHYWLARIGKKIARDDLNKKIGEYLLNKPLHLQKYYKGLLKKWNIAIAQKDNDK